MTTLLPHLSEKAFAGADSGIYTFKVQPDATKHTVRREVEETFGVTVVRVAIAKAPAKPRRRGRLTGTRPGFKKAIVTLKQGDKIKELEM